MCMTFVAGKNASATGRVLIGHNEDDAGHTIVRHGYVPARDWPDGAIIPAEPGMAQIPQASHTFGYHWSELAGPEGGYPWGDAFLNECGVCVTSNNCKFSREDQPELTDGGIAYNLRRAVAERSGSAREGLMVMIDMVETWGYEPSGRCYFVADKDEAFMMQIVSGKRYVAIRIPDDHVVVMPNHYTLRRLDEYEEMYCSPDLVDYAFERGWYHPARDGMFEFARAYQSEKSWRQSLNTLRHVHSLEKLLGKRWDMKKNGLPSSVKVDKKLTVEDFMALLTDHYEGHPDDMRFGPGRAPHDTPHCRVCGADTSESFICDFAQDDPKLTTMWTAFGRPCELPYLPLHPLNGLPEALRTMDDPAQAMQDHLLPNPHLTDYRDTVWQRLHDFSNAVEMVYQDVIGEIARVKKALFDEFSAGNAESLSHPETLLADDAARVEKACKAFEAIELPQAKLLESGLVPVKKGELVRVKFELPACPWKNSLRLGACRVRDHEQQYSKAEQLNALDGNAYEAVFLPDNVLAWSAKGVHESFLGGVDANGKAFVARVMIEAE